MSPGVGLDVACSAATPAQLDSAKAQDNGVGKAQAGEYLWQLSLSASIIRIGLLTSVLVVCSSHNRSRSPSASQWACQKGNKGD